MLVVQPGQHDDGHRRIEHAQPVQGIDTLGIGKIQVEQHAVGAVADQRALGSRHRLHPHQVDIGGVGDIGDLFFDQQRVATVILDQQQG